MLITFDGAHKKPLIITAIITAAFLFLKSPVLAQEENFKEGDRVLVDVNMSGSPEYQRWNKATIIKIHMWNGQLSGYEMKTDEGNTLVAKANYMKKLVETEEKNPNRPPKPEPFQQTRRQSLFKLFALKLCFFLQ